MTIREERPHARGDSYTRRRALPDRLEVCSASNPSSCFHVRPRTAGDPLSDRPRQIKAIFPANHIEKWRPLSQRNKSQDSGWPERNNLPDSRHLSRSIWKGAQCARSFFSARARCRNPPEPNPECQLPTDSAPCRGQRQLPAHRFRNLRFSYLLERPQLPQIPFLQRKSLPNNTALLLATSLLGCDQPPAQFRHDDLGRSRAKRATLNLISLAQIFSISTRSLWRNRLMMHSTLFLKLARRAKRDRNHYGIDSRMSLSDWQQNPQLHATVACTAYMGRPNCHRTRSRNPDQSPGRPHARIW